MQSYSLPVYVWKCGLSYKGSNIGCCMKFQGLMVTVFLYQAVRGLIVTVCSVCRAVRGLMVTVGSLCQAVWGLLVTVGSLCQAVWGLLVTVGSLCQAVWDLLVTVGSLCQAVWGLLVTVGSLCQAVWGLLVNCTVYQAECFLDGHTVPNISEAAGGGFPQNIGN